MRLTLGIQRLRGIRILELIYHIRSVHPPMRMERTHLLPQMRNKIVRVAPAILNSCSYSSLKVRNYYGKCLLEPESLNGMRLIASWAAGAYWQHLITTDKVIMGTKIDSGVKAVI